MSIQYCHDCDKYIDLDTDVEHFEMHMENKKPYSACTTCKKIYTDKINKEFIKKTGECSLCDHTRTN